jgi:heme-degrading monooxygenase HmoA
MMFARATTFESDPEQFDDAAAWIRETVVARSAETPGHRGVLTVADRATGRSTTFTFWDSNEALRASEGRAQQLRTDGSTEFDGHVVDVNRYEVVLDERASHGGASFARMTTMAADPARVEDAIVYMREKVRPIALGLEGHRGLLYLVDRATGTGLTLTFWESEAAMRATEQTASGIRDDAAATLESDVAGVERCEVLVDERR